MNVVQCSFGYMSGFADNGFPSRYCDVPYLYTGDLLTYTWPIFISNYMHVTLVRGVPQLSTRFQVEKLNHVQLRIDNLSN